MLFAPQTSPSQCDVFALPLIRDFLGPLKVARAECCTASALVFNKLFFPLSNPALGTIAAFGTYAVGYLARPLGAAIFGHFGDRLRVAKRVAGVGRDARGRCGGR